MFVFLLINLPHERIRAVAGGSCMSLLRFATRCNRAAARGHTKKLKAVFEHVAPISEEEINILNKRNLFLHGDIENIDGDAMIEIMQKQITLIHKLVLSYIGFDGHIINQYQLRHYGDKSTFMKLN
ncbi:MAG: hypothetical protein ACK5M1_04830 [Xanthomarina gelatinilytica]|uniref:hypothetical protein n=1 Tax=Xanthomarina gelatinilytica TaxID=1137281 RepID=UPI003A8C33E9